MLACGFTREMLAGLVLAGLATVVAETVPASQRRAALLSQSCLSCPSCGTTNSGSSDNDFPSRARSRAGPPPARMVASLGSGANRAYRVGQGHEDFLQEFEFRVF